MFPNLDASYRETKYYYGMYEVDYRLKRIDQIL